MSDKSSLTSGTERGKVVVESPEKSLKSLSLSIKSIGKEKDYVKMLETTKALDKPKPVNIDAMLVDADAYDAQLEAALTHEMLTQLERIFEEADDDGEPGLDMDEFRLAMRQTMGPDLKDEELDMIFMKVDANCDGTVDWEEYLSYMLLEALGQDVMSTDKQKIFPEAGIFMKSDHKDTILTIQFYNTSKARITREGRSDGHHQSEVARVKEALLLDMSQGRYITASIDSAICLWNYCLKPLKSVRPITKHYRTIMVTSIVVIPRYELLFIATTAMSLVVYNIVKDNFFYLNEILKLPECVVELTYHSDPDKHYGLVAGGTDRGCVFCLVFKANPMNTILNSHIYGKILSQTEIILFEKIMENKYEHLEGYFIRDLHRDSIRAIVFLEHTFQYITCSKDEKRALCICDHPDGKRCIYFNVFGGVNAFGYSKALNMIVTGGFDAFLRVWNPSINTKPVLVLSGHQNPITQIQILELREQVISVDESKEVRLFDLNLQTCIQAVDRNVLLEMGPKPILATHYNPTLQRYILGTDRLAILDKGFMVTDLQNLRTHDTEVGLVRYNPLFCSIVSACWDSTICVWNIVTGQKIMQFKGHTVRDHGLIKEYEVTAMCFDPTFRRLLTAGRDGLIKVWNFNNGAALREIETFSDQEINAIVFNRTKILTGGWNRRLIVYVDDSDDDTFQFLYPEHWEDITSIAVHDASQLFVSSAYNGDMYVWTATSGRMLSYMNHNMSDKQLPPYQYSGKEQCQRLSITATKRAMSLDNDGETTNHEKHGKRESIIPPTTDRRNTVGSSFLQKMLEFEPCPVVKILCINSRTVHPHTAVLFTASSDGYIRGWSIHNQGGLLGQFFSGEIPGHGLTDMVTSNDEDLLIVTDSAGYVKVWYIEHYLIKESSCTEECESQFDNYMYWRLKRILKRTNHLDKLVCHPDPENLHLLTSFQAHLQTITSVDFLFTGDRDYHCLVTGSIDCSVRVWSIDGEFLGIVGQPHMWNILDANLPLWRDEEYTGNEDNEIRTVTKGMVPEDILCSAGMQTLFILKRGYFKNWRRCVHLVRLVLIRKKAELAVSDELEAAKLERKIRGKNIEFGSWTTDTSLPVMGKYAVQIFKSRPKVSLLKPRVLKSVIPVFRCLPLMTFKQPAHPMSQPLIRKLRKSCNLPPLELHKGIGNVFQKIVTLTQMVSQNASKRTYRDQFLPLKPKLSLLTSAMTTDYKNTILKMRRSHSKSMKVSQSVRKMVEDKKGVDKSLSKENGNNEGRKEGKKRRKNKKVDFKKQKQQQQNKNNNNSQFQNSHNSEANEDILAYSSEEENYDDNQFPSCSQKPIMKSNQIIINRDAKKMTSLADSWASTDKKTSLGEGKNSARYKCESRISLSRPKQTLKHGLNQGRESRTSGSNNNSNKVDTSLQTQGPTTHQLLYNRDLRSYRQTEEARLLPAPCDRDFSSNKIRESSSNTDAFSLSKTSLREPSLHGKTYYANSNEALPVLATSTCQHATSPSVANNQLKQSKEVSSPSQLLAKKKYNISLITGLPLSEKPLPTSTKVTQARTHSSHVSHGILNPGRSQIRHDKSRLPPLAK